jgi:hypothetical protein
MQTNTPLHQQIIHPLLHILMLRNLLDVLSYLINGKMVIDIELASLS